MLTRTKGLGEGGASGAHLRSQMMTKRPRRSAAAPGVPDGSAQPVPKRNCPRRLVAAAALALDPDTLPPTAQKKPPTTLRGDSVQQLTQQRRSSAARDDGAGHPAIVVVSTLDPPLDPPPPPPKKSTAATLGGDSVQQLTQHYTCSVLQEMRAARNFIDDEAVCGYSFAKAPQRAPRRASQSALSLRALSIVDSRPASRSPASSTKTRGAQLAAFGTLSLACARQPSNAPSALR